MPEFRARLNGKVYFCQTLDEVLHAILEGFGSFDRLAKEIENWDDDPASLHAYYREVRRRNIGTGITKTAWDSRDFISFPDEHSDTQSMRVNLDYGRHLCVWFEGRRILAGLDRRVNRGGIVRIIMVVSLTADSPAPRLRRLYKNRKLAQ